MQLNQVTVVQFVVALDTLAIENARTPNSGGLQRMLEITMDFPGKVQHGATDGKREGSGPIGWLARHLGINSQAP